MDGLIQDVRHALRALRRKPGFAAAAVLTLALGIGANTAVFTVLDAVLLRPLPYEQPERLVRVWGERPERGRTRVNNSPQDFLDWREQATSFASLSAYAAGAVTVDTGGDPVRLPTLAVSHDLLETLGVQPYLGRGFRPEEDAPGGEPVVLLTHATWRERLGGDPDVLGRTLQVDGRPATVIGVLPATFRPPLYSDEASTPAALLQPLRIGPENGRGGHWVSVVGRLLPGVDLSRAQAEMDGITGRLAQAHADTNIDWTVRLETLHRATVGPARAPLWMLAAAVGLVLLITCANLSNLLLMRTADRGREIAVRAALGASRGRITRQLVTESLLLGLLGGAAGLLLAHALVRSLVSLAGDALPRAGEVSIDARVLVFLAVVSLGAGALIGLLPALRASSGHAAELNQGARGSTSAGGSRLRDALVVLETALALLLCAGAALLGKSFVTLNSVDAGFRRDAAVAIDLSLPHERYGGPGRAAFYGDLLAGLERLPAVTAAGAVNMIPLGESYSCDGFTLDGRPWEPGQDECAEVRIAAGEYFRAMEIPLLRGRAFDAADRAGAPPVAMINDAMARRFWPGEDPVGRRLTYDTSREIVGVVGDVRHFGLDRPAAPEIYLPHPQYPVDDLTLVVAGTPSDPVAEIRAAVRAADPDLPLGRVRTLGDLVAGSISAPRFRSLLLGAFATLSLCLAAVGLYGVLAYAVAGRTRELGVRLALGACPADLLRQVVGRGAALALLGVALGLAAVLGLAPLISGFLYRVSPRDPAMLATVAAVLLATGVGASWLPGRRATRVDPVIALRHD